MSNRKDWKTEDIYTSIDAWQTEFDQIESKICFDEFKGKLDNKEDFVACMRKQEKVLRVIEKLSVYAMMLHDTDTKNSVYDSLTAKATTLSVKFSSASAFILPELTSLKEEKLNEYILDKDLSSVELKELTEKKWRRPTLPQLNAVPSARLGLTVLIVGNGADAAYVLALAVGGKTCELGVIFIPLGKCLFILLRT